MIEFAFILPMFTFMLLFSLDMGHLVMLRGAMADATFAAARTGAQIGGAGLDTTGNGRLVCPNNGACAVGNTWGVLSESVRLNVPGASTVVNKLKMTIVSGAKCRNGTDDHVVLNVTYTTKPITPGLGAILKMINTSAGKSTAPGSTDWALHTVSIARCEVIRSP